MDWYRIDKYVKYRYNDGYKIDRCIDIKYIDK